MATHTLDRLARDGFDTVPVVGEDATRAGLEAALGDDVAGVALFSHGRVAPKGTPVAVDDAIVGMEREPALDRENISRLRGCWAHALACHSGTELARVACDSGVDCFVGYDCSLSVEWDPATLPDAVKPLLAELVTQTSCNLAAGIRDPERLRDEVRAIERKIIKWCKVNPGCELAFYLRVTAHQLWDRLVFEPRKPPTPAMTAEQA